MIRNHPAMVVKSRKLIKLKKIKKELIRIKKIIKEVNKRRIKMLARRATMRRKIKGVIRVMMKMMVTKVIRRV